MATVTHLGTTFNTSSGDHSVAATPNVNDLIVIITASSGNTATTAPTDDNADGNGTYTLIIANAKKSNADEYMIFVRDHLVGSGTSTNFDHNPGASTGGGLSVFSVSGMTKVGSTASRQAGSENLASGTPIFNFTGGLGNVLTTNPVICFTFNGTNPGGMTAPAGGFTSVEDIGYGTPATGLDTFFINSGFTGDGNTSYGGSSATPIGEGVIELDASGASASSPQGVFQTTNKFFGS